MRLRHLLASAVVAELCPNPPQHWHFIEEDTCNCWPISRAGPKWEAAVPTAELGHSPKHSNNDIKIAKQSKATKVMCAGPAKWPACDAFPMSLSSHLKGATTQRRRRSGSSLCKERSAVDKPFKELNSPSGHVIILRPLACPTSK